jgi:DNA gyrase subunit A
MPEEELEQRIIPQPIEEEMERSYIDYSMSVIVGRALPDVRDGLKPVHRRILHSMDQLGVRPGGPHRKSARIVGECLGRYHPHGDQAVYDALARMTQDFSLRYPLVDGQGNWGSVDGDPPAAMRYTECRLDRIAEEMLQDLDRDTVDFVDNFDGTAQEPEVLPAKLPNLLVNGSSGIAVGMATNIPPHNLGEIVDGLVALIENPEIELEELVNPESGPIRGPDFPTGGTIYGVAGVWEAYHTGRGLVQVRAKTEVEDMGKGKSRIVVTEIPYMVNKTSLLETIADLVKDRKIDGITDLRDESDRSGMRIVIELRRDAMEDVVLNQLYKHSQLQTTFGIINIALVDGEPRVLTLKKTMQHYLSFREEVVRRRTEFELRKAEQRAHILQGLITALDHLDDVINLIRRSESAEAAREGLMSQFLLSEGQAKAILSMQLQRLTALESEKIREEEEGQLRKIEELKAILESEERVLGIIKEELQELKDKFGDPRRTEIVTHAEDLMIEDLIPNERVLVAVTQTGYIKRMTLDTYRTQHRGGVGLIGMETKEGDYVTDLFSTRNHDHVLFFTNQGRVYWLKTYRIPMAGRHARGKPIINLLPRLEDGEEVAAILPLEDFEEDKYLVFATKNGRIKRTSLAAYFPHKKTVGKWAIKLLPGDELVEVRRVQPEKDIILASRMGQAARFPAEEVRSTGRYTTGVIGARLARDDRVVSMAIAGDDDILLTVTEKGYGKRSRVSEYRRTHRGAKGVRNIRLADKNGPVVAVRTVVDDDELILTSEAGMVIRIPVYEDDEHQIRIMGRATMGVRIMKLRRKDDKVVAVAKLVREKELEESAEAFGEEDLGYKLVLEEEE